MQSPSPYSVRVLPHVSIQCLFIISPLALSTASTLTGFSEQWTNTAKASKSTGLPGGASQSTPSSAISLKPTSAVGKSGPAISFEKTVYDLGDVGQSTKNTCEFRFTNTGQAPLKITNVRRTCGCTVFQLDKKECAPGEAGLITVSYTVDRSTGLREKHIYVSSNDNEHPNLKLTIKARVVQLISVAPEKLQLFPREPKAGIPDSKRLDHSKT